MKIIKIQQEIMKAAEARDAVCDEKKFNFLHFIKDDHIYIVSNGAAIYIIPMNKFYLDVDKTFKKAPVKLENLLKEEWDADELVDCKIEKTIPATKQKVMVLQNKNGEEIWLNVKLMNVFDKEWCTYKGSSAKAPVFIYEEGVLSGVVLPIAHP